jgi:hypothetical protein
VRQVIQNDRNWSFLVFIIFIGIVVGAGMGLAAKAITPLLAWAKSPSIETAKTKRKTLLPERAPQGVSRTA